MVILTPEPLLPTSAVVIPTTSPVENPFPVWIPNVFNTIPFRVPSALNTTVCALRFLPLPTIEYNPTSVYVPAE